jgi:hypothetical protein
VYFSGDGDVWGKYNAEKNRIEKHIVEKTENDEDEQTQESYD